jgi:GDP-4-dehydro-6-deoxy-D-mannose reductase
VDAQGSGSGARVTWEAVDLLDRAAVRAALEQVRPTIIYHCAGAAHVGRSWNKTETTFAVNVKGTHHLLEGLREMGLGARVLLPGSALVYAPALHALREDHRPWFFGSGFARRIADIEAKRWPPEIAVGNLEARRDLTDVRDTVRAYRMIVEKGVAGRAYNVCSGRAIAVRELLDMMLARARVPIEVKIDSARYRPNDAPLLLGDPARIRDELGWAPQIPIEQTIDDLLQYWRSQ